jgi:uncharacterized damage-inducible protein DinB
MASGYVAGILGAMDFGFDRMKANLEGLSPEQLTKVPTGLKNSIAGLVLHAYGTEVGMAHRLSGQSVPDDVKSAYLLNQPQNPLPQPQGETIESLIGKMEKARGLLKAAVEKLTDADLDKEWEAANGRKMSYRFMLNLLPQHQGQHFGQIQMIKQLNG